MTVCGGDGVESFEATVKVPSRVLQDDVMQGIMFDANGKHGS